METTFKLFPIHKTTSLHYIKLNYEDLKKKSKFQNVNLETAFAAL